MDRECRRRENNNNNKMMMMMVNKKSHEFLERAVNDIYLRMFYQTSLSFFRSTCNIL
jgi:hypothetical protein